MANVISPMKEEDRESVIDIFNYYVENSFAAFPENPVPYQTFDLFLQMSAGLTAVCVKDRGGKLLGFAMLKKFNPFPTFSRTAEVTYFIAPAHTGRGIGRDLLAYLERTAQEKGIKTLLAHISSLNAGSIRFHEQNGFAETGRFVEVGEKNGRLFDSVWMQKTL